MANARVNIISRLNVAFLHLQQWQRVVMLMMRWQEESQSEAYASFYSWAVTGTVCRYGSSGHTALWQMLGSHRHVHMLAVFLYTHIHTTPFTQAHHRHWVTDSLCLASYYPFSLLSMKRQAAAECAPTLTCLITLLNPPWHGPCSLLC